MTENSEREHAKDAEPARSVWAEAHDLIRRLEGSSVQRLSIQTGEFRVEIERGAPTVIASAPAAGLGAASVAPGRAEPAPAADNRHAVVAPLVGTYYGAPQPGAKPFVAQGDVVEQGQTVAIVEAMKIMNQIVADRRGRVAEVVCKDGDWVEFEQALMYLEPVEG